MNTKPQFKKGDIVFSTSENSRYIVTATKTESHEAFGSLHFIKVDGGLEWFSEDRFYKKKQSYTVVFALVVGLLFVVTMFIDQLAQKKYTYEGVCEKSFTLSLVLVASLLAYLIYAILTIKPYHRK